MEGGQAEAEEEGRGPAMMDPGRSCPEQGDEDRGRDGRAGHRAGLAWRRRELLADVAAQGRDAHVVLGGRVEWPPRTWPGEEGRVQDGMMVSVKGG